MEEEDMLKLAQRAQRGQERTGEMILKMLSTMRNNKIGKKGGIKTKNIEIPSFEGEGHQYQEWKKTSVCNDKELKCAG